MKPILLTLMFLFFGSYLFSQAGSGTINIVTECDKGCATSCNAFCGTNSLILVVLQLQKL